MIRGDGFIFRQGLKSYRVTLEQWSDLKFIRRVKISNRATSPKEAEIFALNTLAGGNGYGGGFWTIEKTEEVGR